MQVGLLGAMFVCSSRWVLRSRHQCSPLDAADILCHTEPARATKDVFGLRNEMTQRVISLSYTLVLHGLRATRIDPFVHGSHLFFCHKDPAWAYKPPMSSLWLEIYGATNTMILSINERRVLLDLDMSLNLSIFTRLTWLPFTRQKRIGLSSQCWAGARLAGWEGEDFLTRLT